MRRERADMPTDQPTKVPTWKANPDLIARLTAAQNRLTHIDIMTFGGFCDSRAELLRHVERYEAQAKEAA